MTTIRIVTTEDVNRVLGRTRRARTAPLVANRVLQWHDDWANADRILRWQGPCLGCGTQTWGFDDGENDPRGILGDAAQWSVVVDGPDGTEHFARACNVCVNNAATYAAIKSVAVKIGLDKAAPYQWGRS